MYKVLDLFCGTGGFSYGFEKAGFKILLGIDNEEHKLRTYNYSNPSGKQNIQSIEYSLLDPKNNQKFDKASGDITKLTAEKITNLVNKDCIDVLIGSPPCKKYSKANSNNQEDNNDYIKHQDISTKIKTKLKNFYLNDNNTAITSPLDLEFLRLVLTLRPKWFIMENVPELYDQFHGELLKILFEPYGYTVRLYQYVNCANFGLPQTRKRAFLIGNIFGFVIDLSPILSEDHFVTVRDAIGDLDETEPLSSKEIKAQERIKTINPKQEPLSEYQLNLRKDLDGNISKSIKNHVKTYHEYNTINKIKLINQGKSAKDYPQIFCVKKKSCCNQCVEKDICSKIHISSTHSNAYRRLNYDKPSNTITTKYRHISAGPIHPIHDRCITDREAARLQSFPDNFEFIGTSTEVSIQIGDAVPPLMAELIAVKIKDLLDTFN